MRRNVLGTLVIAAALGVSAGAYAEDLSGAAYSTCQMFALERLPTRASVRFAGLGERGTGSYVPRGSNPDRFEVFSFVDSKTTSGMPLRRRLYCDMRSLGRDRWALRKIVLEEVEPVSLSRPLSAARLPAARP